MILLLLTINEEIASRRSAGESMYGCFPPLEEYKGLGWGINQSINQSVNQSINQSIN
jgi:hypothetical protein